jgi:nitroreductase
MTSPKQATPDHPIQPLIADRWSPNAFADRPVPDDDLRSVFEAARWSASYNEQPWRYVVATKANPAEFERRSPAWWRGTRSGPGPRRSWPSAARA